MIKSVSAFAACLAACFVFSTASQAMVLNMGESARIDFTATTGTTPFDFVTFNLMFAAANPFGPNETLTYETFDGDNQTLLSTTAFSSGSSVYTSGLFGQLTRNAIVPFNLTTALTTQSFSVLVTASTGSFDLTGATADFEHILTSGQNQLGVEGAFATVPEPSPWAMMLVGFAGLAFARYRWSGKAAATAA
jgi:hypothetical protein